MNDLTTSPASVDNESSAFWNKALGVREALKDLINEEDTELVRLFAADLMRHLNPSARVVLAMQIMTYEASPDGTRPRGGHRDFLVHLADEMGPDWAQTLYQAAVFVTKVA